MKLKKKFITAFAAASCTIFFTSGLPVFAATQIMPDGYPFDSQYYAQQNPDVAQQLGTDPSTLFQHFLNYGLKENRLPFDPNTTDINALFAQAQTNPSVYFDQKSIPTYNPYIELKKLMPNGSAEDIAKVVASVAKLSPAAPPVYISYQLGDNTFTIGPEIAMVMMKTNPDGSYYVDPSTHYYVVDQEKAKILMNAVFSILGKAPSTGAGFQASNGKMVQLNGTVNNLQTTSIADEVSYISKAVLTPGTYSRVPITQPKLTYVEVDMTNQKVYFYKDGKLLVSSSIVTGNVSTDHSTPAGVYKLKAKMTDTYLVGEDYRSHVDYWMPFIGNSVGLHDASWRRYFGGKIYETSGSHGCVNLPHNVAEKIFQNIDVGTPVIVF